MVTRDAKEYPETISSEIQGGRPLHFLRVLSWVPLLEYPPNYYILHLVHDGAWYMKWWRRRREAGTRKPGHRLSLLRPRVLTSTDGTLLGTAQV
jgi:hypothetical protein